MKDMVVYIKSITENCAETLHNFCCNLILKALEEHDGLPKFKINQLLFEYLPQHLTEEQKDWKVSRLLTTLRDSGDIFLDTGKIWRKSK